MERDASFKRGSDLGTLTPHQAYNAPWHGKSPWSPEMEKNNAASLVSLSLRSQVDPGPPGSDAEVDVWEGPALWER